MKCSIQYYFVVDRETMENNTAVCNLLAEFDFAQQEFIRRLLHEDIVLVVLSNDSRRRNDEPIFRLAFEGHRGEHLRLKEPFWVWKIHARLNRASLGVDNWTHEGQSPGDLFARQC